MSALASGVGAALFLAGSWALAFGVLPRLLGALARRMGLGLAPLTRKRLARFRRIRRGYVAWTVLVTLTVASGFLELVVNDRPLYVRYGETVRWPAVADWANTVLPGTPFARALPARDFGVDAAGDLDARTYARWVHDPASLEREARALEEANRADEERFRERMAREAADQGLAYDASTPLPEWKQEALARRTARAEELRAMVGKLAEHDAGIVLTLHPYSPREQVLGLEGVPPHRPFRPGVPILGTDASGKEVLSQLAYGFRLSLAFALVVAAIGYGAGVLIGGAMGYYGGWFDILVQRVIEVWTNIPFLFTMMIIASIVKPGFWILALMLVVLSAWTGITFQVRGEFFRERTRDYVQAARAIGVGDGAIMRRHILPNALVSVVTLLPFAVVGFVLALVSLDYLGFGLPPGTPSWGRLLNQGSENIVNYPHLVVIPVIALAGTLLSVVTIGEAIREAFDPRAHQRIR